MSLLWDSLFIKPNWLRLNEESESILSRGTFATFCPPCPPATPNGVDDWKPPKHAIGVSVFWFERTSAG